MRELGFENFLFEVVEECSKEFLNDREIFWIEYYNSYKDGYNSNYGGTGKQYNYNEIFEYWKKGYQCKEIKEIFGCGDETITKALRENGISVREVMSKVQKAEYYVALDIDTGKPLKIFRGEKSIGLFFEKNELGSRIKKAIQNNYSAYGYYWEYLTEDNKPDKVLSNDEFLSYQKLQGNSCSKEKRLKLSLANRTIERPSRTELKDLIRTKSFLQIGRDYNVTDNTIRKWCKFENLPYKKSEIKKYSDEEWDKI